MRYNKQQSGFTILELLIVIAIIGIIAAIVLVSVSESRRKSRNAAVISQMYEYQKALNLYFSETSSYPNPGVPAAYTRRYCLGDGSSHPTGCWSGASAGPGPISALVPEYMPSLPGFDQGNLGSPAYLSCVGTGAHSNGQASNPAVCGPNKFSLLFVLEGLNQDCGRAVQVDPGFESDEGEYTLCRLNMP